MKYLVKFFVVTLLFLASTHAFAEQKIAVLDMQFVLNNSSAGKSAQDYLQNTFKKNQKKFSKIESELKKQENDLLEKKNLLSKEEYKKKADELRKSVIKFQKESRESLDKIATQRSSARQDLLKNIDPILNNYIKKNNISMVIDKKYVLGGHTDLDITNVIIEKLNKELPSLNLK